MPDHYAFYYAGIFDGDLLMDEERTKKILKDENKIHGAVDKS